MEIPLPVAPAGPATATSPAVIKHSPNAPQSNLKIARDTGPPL